MDRMVQDEWRRAVTARAEGKVLEARVAAGAVGKTPIRLGGVEAALSGASRDELAERAQRLDEVDPPSDSNASAAYRKKVLGVLVRRSLLEAFDRAGVGESGAGGADAAESGAGESGSGESTDGSGRGEGQ
jgi:hypothetical protein